MAQTQARNALVQAVSDLGLDPACCVILGDKTSDIEAGSAVGIGLRVLIGPRDAKIGGPPPYEAVADLGEALAFFRSRFAPIVPDQRSAKP